MKKNLIRLAILLCSSMAITAQNIELKWSNKFIYDNKLDGFFDGFLGANDKYIYAEFHSLRLMFNQKDKKTKILAFDKTTMTKVSEVVVAGYDPARDREVKDMNFFKSIVSENVIYLLWTKRKSDVIEIYVESYNPQLKKVNSLKKIYEINDSKKNNEDFVILFNKDIGNKILLCKELNTKEDENLKIEYRLVNEDFSFANSAQVTLPIVMMKKKKRTGGLVCDYMLADDGKIYVKDVVKINDEDKKSLKKGEATVYPVIMQISPETNELKKYSVKFPKKNTFNFSWLVSKNSIRLYGFFCDLNKDPKGNDTHGIFHIAMTQDDFTPKDEKFSYFDKGFLDKLYAADQENQKQGGFFRNKDAKQSDEESIDDNYVIEQTVEDGKDLLMFCSIMQNWKKTVCSGTANGATNCRTYYYCTKSNVTTFKLSESGDIIWASNLDRVYTYNRWNVYDLSVVKNKNDEYIVVYQSQYQIKGPKKRRNKKSKKQLTDRFEYAVFQGKTGDYTKAEYQVNGFNTKKADEKYIEPANILVLDNQMFTSCSRVKYKPTTFISCLCPPVFYFLSYSGNSRKGSGYLGVINTLK